ncbi:interferon beta [Oryctolagus cuniculus]|uniref:Interferon beta n=1 Tax=Oryctolagus cuniculus TaxID=9986 RepID=G1TTX4_RABIT|nr:interferon beta [Oryctolagus cuniculus]CAB0000287.1 TPA: interferon 1DA1 [Oryctolagus cuniculus]
MINRCILQIALLLCFSTTALSMSYNSLQIQLWHGSLTCAKLLLQLNGTTEDCLNERINFKVPKEIKEPQQLQKEDTTLVIFEMLNNIFDIFRKNFSSTGWNETLVENLLGETHLQIHHLKSKINKKVTLESIRMNLRLKSYYWRIMDYLETKQYSNCAWKIVQLEIFRNFSFIIMLIDYL